MSPHSEPKLLAANTKRGCPWKEVKHGLDEGMKTAGSWKIPIMIDVPKDSGDKYVQFEYDYIGMRLGYKGAVCVQFLLSDGEKWCDRMVARIPNGDHYVFYFDVSNHIISETTMEKGYQTMKMLANQGKLPSELKQALEEEERKRKKKK